MIKLFYQDKVIIFETKNNINQKKDVFFEDKPIIDQILCRLNDQNELIIISENEDRAFAHFEKDFKPITACGGMVTNPSGETLMIFRNERWDLPKGKIEDGESLEQCAVREVIEETGIEGITTVGEPHITKHIYNIYGCWELKTTYWYNMSYNPAKDCRKDMSFVPQTEEGITACEWLSKTKMDILSHNSYAAIKDVIKQLTKNI